MTLYQLSVIIRDFRAEFGDDVEVKSYLNKNLSPYLSYSLEDDCVYIDAL